MLPTRRNIAALSGHGNPFGTGLAEHMSIQAKTMI